ncbi:MAG TPA: diguanylate cyclase [Gaiellaceae bacterium]|nr:diguanylate cyclase [Gaiellaceae bacterium]
MDGITGGDPGESRRAVSEVDPISLLGSRGQLIDDLELSLEADGPSRVLAVFDLAGLYEYRTVHGVLAGDDLTDRLARVFVRAMKNEGRCYRSRQDELCAIVDAPADKARPVLDAAAAALREEGAPSFVTVSFGMAFLPREASDPIEALTIADQELAVARRGRERRQPGRAHLGLTMAEGDADRL